MSETNSLPSPSTAHEPEVPLVPAANLNNCVCSSGNRIQVQTSASLGSPSTPDSSSISSTSSSSQINQVAGGVHTPLTNGCVMSSNSSAPLTNAFMSETNNPADGAAVPNGGQWIKLNVGGTHFLTTKTTLSRDPKSFLCRLIQDDTDLISNKVRKNPSKNSEFGNAMALIALYILIAFTLL